MELWGQHYVERRLKQVEEHQRLKLGIEKDDDDMIVQRSSPLLTMLTQQGTQQSQKETGAVSHSQKIESDESTETPVASNGTQTITSSNAPSTSQPSLDEILSRPQRLEHKLDQQQQAKKDKRQQLLERSKQNGIQSCFEDNLLTQERQRKKQKQQQQEHSSTATTTGDDDNESASPPTV